MRDAELLRRRSQRGGLDRPVIDPARSARPVVDGQPLDACLVVTGPPGDHRDASRTRPLGDRGARGTLGRHKQHDPRLLRQAGP